MDFVVECGCFNREGEPWCDLGLEEEGEVMAVEEVKEIF